MFTVQLKNGDTLQVQIEQLEEFSPKTRDRIISLLSEDEADLNKTPTEIIIESLNYNDTNSTKNLYPSRIPAIRSSGRRNN